MTPEFLLEALIKHLTDGTRPSSRAEPPREWAAGARITREAEPDQRLVAVVRLGCAGLPSAMALRSAGFRIVGIDASPSRLNDIRSARAELLGVHREELRVTSGRRPSCSPTGSRPSTRPMWSWSACPPLSTGSGARTSNG